MSKYEEFGVALRAYRVAANETIEDVSGAVEIDSSTLKKIENGSNRPAQDILRLLIIHFALRDKEANRLIKLAGYDEEDIITGKQTVQKEIDAINIGEEAIAYTDVVHVVSNKYGVVMNFIQGFDESGKSQVVARVGMSKEHAKSVLELLQKTLENADQ